MHDEVEEFSLSRVVAKEMHREIERMNNEAKPTVTKQTKRSHEGLVWLLTLGILYICFYLFYSKPR
jgi:hypothetical protein